MFTKIKYYLSVILIILANLIIYFLLYLAYNRFLNSQKVFIDENCYQNIKTVLFEGFEPEMIVDYLYETRGVPDETFFIDDTDENYIILEYLVQHGNVDFEWDGNKHETTSKITFYPNVGFTFGNIFSNCFQVDRFRFDSSILLYYQNERKIRINYKSVFKKSISSVTWYEL